MVDSCCMYTTAGVEERRCRQQHPASVVVVLKGYFLMLPYSSVYTVAWYSGM